MEKTIKTHLRGSDDLARFWNQYFQETPVCSLPECSGVAAEVDSFFPYLDDLNRCESHPLELKETIRRPAQGCLRVGPPSVHRAAGKAFRLSLPMKHRMRLYR